MMEKLEPKHTFVDSELRIAVRNDSDVAIYFSYTKDDPNKVFFRTLDDIKKHCLLATRDELLREEDMYINTNFLLANLHFLGISFKEVFPEVIFNKHIELLDAHDRTEQVIDYLVSGLIFWEISQSKKYLKQENQ